jgi:hypothetical protein
MLVTLVIRLVPEGLAAGRFVGQVEHVGSGDPQTVRGVSDLVGFAQRAVADLESPAARVKVGSGSPEAGRGVSEDTEVEEDGG